MSPCDSCHAGCCRAFAVPITGADVLRLEANGSQFWDFAARWADEDGEIARRHAPHLFFADEPETPFVLGLLHAESRTLPGTSRCVFLAEESPTDRMPLGRGSCSVYAHRPMTCRAFPVKFDKQQELIQLEAKPSNGRRGDSNPAYSLCPRRWEATDVDPVETPATLAAAMHEMQFFHKIAALWNKRPGDWQTFPAFLRAVYRSRVRVIEENEQRSVVIPVRPPAATEDTGPTPHAA